MHGRRALAFLAPEGRGRAAGTGLLVFAGVVLFVVTTRTPFLRMTLAGEEGANARGIVMLAKGHLPRMVIARSSRGEEYLIPAGHNLGGYLLPAALAAPVVRLTGFTSLEQRARAARGLRGCYLVIYCMTLIVALFLVDPSRRALAALLLCAFSLPTLPLIASVQVNYDGAVTPLLVLLTLLVFQRATTRGSIAWAALAGALLSLGKLEYTVAVAVALLLSEGLTLRWRLWPPFAATLLVGIFFWRWADPDNFNYGFNVIGRFWTLQGGSSAPIVPRALTYARTNLELLWPTYAGLVLAILGVAVTAARGRPVRELSAIGLSMLFIMLGYHAIAWRGDGFPRYLAPCFPLAALLLARIDLPRWLGAAVAVALIAISLGPYRRSVGNRERMMASLIRTGRDDLALAKQLEAAPRGCMTVTDMDGGVGFYSRTASFACCFAQWTEWPAQQRQPLCP